MAHRKFFIRKTQCDLIQDQTKIIEDFCNKQPKKTVEQEYIERRVSESSYERIEEKEDDDEIPYIPNLSISKAVCSGLSLNTSTSKIDDDDIQKLKKIRADATKLV